MISSTLFIIVWDTSYKNLSTTNNIEIPLFSYTFTHWYEHIKGLCAHHCINCAIYAQHSEVKALLTYRILFRTVVVNIPK